MPDLFASSPTCPLMEKYVYFVTSCNNILILLQKMLLQLLAPCIATGEVPGEEKCQQVITALPPADAKYITVSQVQRLWEIGFLDVQHKSRTNTIRALAKKKDVSEESFLITLRNKLWSQQDIEVKLNMLAFQRNAVVQV